MLNLNPVYNYYSSVYQPQKQTKYDSHKTSELKNIYNTMIKINQKSPLYKVKLNENTQQYAIGLKSAAIGLHNFSTFLSDEEVDAFSKLTAASSNIRALEAQVVTSDYSSMPESMTFSIDKLATTQMNSSDMVLSNHLDTAIGKHTFSIKTEGSNYGFNFNVKEGDNNEIVLNRMSNFLNQTDVGINAYVRYDGNRCQLVLESDTTGTDNTTSGMIFQIYDNEGDGIISDYQLNHVARYPEDAVFSINQMEQHSSSNNIAINHMVEIELKQVTQDDITVKFVPDNEDIIRKMNDFVQSYNDVVDLALAQSDSHRGAKKLLHEIKGITNRHYDTLESVGLSVDDSGRIQTDEALLSQNISNGNVKELFSDISGFKSDILQKTSSISLNPMNYVDKTVITYPNPARTFNNAYLPSIYSGMMFNYYA